MRSSVDRAAPWLHALFVGLVAAATAWQGSGQSTRAAIVGALIFGAVRGAGWFVLKYVRPVGGHPPSLRVMRRDVERLMSDLHHMNNRASVLLGELELLEHDRKDQERRQRESP